MRSECSHPAHSLAPSLGRTGVLFRFRPRHGFLVALAGLPFTLNAAQQATPAPQPVASVATEGVTLHGAMSVANGRASIANNGEITAGDRTAQVALLRGGTLEVCASTTLHIAKDVVPHASAKPGDAGLMFSIDRGAFEASYTPGAYSDVVLTPDLRLLISGPGEANLKMQVNRQGDTCVDNAGANAPYVIASSLMDGGAYRVRPGQRVLFVHGSLNEVVDNEHEPCGCPSAAPEPEVAAHGKKTGGPSSTPADTEFPTAVSEGLQAPPTLPGTPVVPAGEAHAQVSATLSSNTPPTPPPAAPPVASAPSPASPPAAPQKPPARRRGFFHSIGHFFAKVFGAS